MRRLSSRSTNIPCELLIFIIPWTNNNEHVAQRRLDVRPSSTLQRPVYSHVSKCVCRFSFNPCRAWHPRFDSAAGHSRRMAPTARVWRPGFPGKEVVFLVGRFAPARRPRPPAPARGRWAAAAVEAAAFAAVVLRLLSLGRPAGVHLPEAAGAVGRVEGGHGDLRSPVRRLVLRGRERRG